MDNKDSENLGSYYMNRPHAEKKRPRPLKALLALLALGVFGGILWHTYPRNMQDRTEAEIPVVKASTTPIKTVPDDPGGMDIPYQDSTVFEQLAKTPPPPEAESLRPAPAEEPVLKKEDLAPQEEVKAKPKAEAQKTEVAKEDAAPKETGQAIGDYFIQLGSFKEQASAQEGWKRLLKKYPDLLRGLSNKIVRSDVPGKGVYYRLQAGKMTQERAKKICADMKASGNNGCMVIK